MKRFDLPAQIESIAELTDGVNEELEAAGCPMRVQLQIDIAIDELFSNIARYAYDDHNGEASVILEITGEPKTARLTFVDSGKPFNPLLRENPDVTLGVEERKIGGLGIFVVKKSMDNVEYNFEDGKNILTIEKRFG